MKIQSQFGLGHKHQDPQVRKQLIEYLNMKLAAQGQPIYQKACTENLTLAEDLIRHLREKNDLLGDYLPPIDQRIQNFLDSYLAGESEVPRLVSRTLVLSRYGLARELSLPPDEHQFRSPLLTSYRLKQGILHNPLHDRRTTKGVFHVAEGGLPIPFDKKAVPKAVYAKLLAAALRPPEEFLVLPFTAMQKEKAKGFLSLFLRPLVSPGVPGLLPEKSMEVHFFSPGALVSNLDFVESIFGNAGDPYLPENDAALSPENWTGHTGCVILAVHLTRLKKKDLGLPFYDQATARQKKDGMCWKDPDELYNDGNAFKICARDERGVMVTLIADNYYGYSKKEIKTQISYSANLMGLAEEEHSGGVLAFPRYNLGAQFILDGELKSNEKTFSSSCQLLADSIEVKKEGYAVDRMYQDIVYIPEDAEFDLEQQRVFWHRDGKDFGLRLLPKHHYLYPSGFKVHIEKHPATTAWRLVGTAAEGTLCHKPCTVSGGGKSEISKSISDAIHFNPIIIGDYEKDMELVEQIIKYDFSQIESNSDENDPISLPFLSEKRSLNESIKLLTPSNRYTNEHNLWLKTIPSRIKALVYLIKRFYSNNPHHQDKWREHFSVDVVNGTAGNIFKFNGRPIMGAYLRIGIRENGSNLTYKLRQDFMPALKIQWEDDISASVTVSSHFLKNLNPEYSHLSVKFAQNCEFRFFQRPDDAIFRGYDKQAEHDLSQEGNFISNFEAFPQNMAKDFYENVKEFTEYTRPVQNLIVKAIKDSSYQYFMLPSHPRLIHGIPSKNPRYLQLDPNYARPKDRYLAETGVRLARSIGLNEPVFHPINAILSGRRNNPADYKAKIRPLAVYNPLHYQELPELFMDFVCSLTGKSPSTTGAGSEGALTKGPFNALVPTTDLNNALLSFILTGYDGFSSAAGHIGQGHRIAHDISLLVPELWCRMTFFERDPQWLIQNGFLEKIEDFTWQGRSILASRLGYRITYEFTTYFLGRIFDDPGIVFTKEMLRPELQSMKDFVDGIENIVEAQTKTAQQYFEDGSIEAAVPPLKALLHIMAHGHWEGKTVSHPDIRKLFDRQEVIASDWYQRRLVEYQRKQIDLFQSHKTYLSQFLQKDFHQNDVFLLEVNQALQYVETHLTYLQTPAFLKNLEGTIGLDLLYKN